MKKIIFLMLLTVAVLSSCKPCNPPFGPGNPNGPGGPGGTTGPGGYTAVDTEPGSPDVSNQGKGVNVFDDYYNRYKLVTEDGSVYVSNYGTLVWYNQAIDRCPKLCWVDVCVVKNGYALEVYWYNFGNLYKKVYDAREYLSLDKDILICHPSSPDYPYQRAIEIYSHDDGVIIVALKGDNDETLEYFKM